MDFQMAMKYIDDKNKLGIVPGLDNIKELLRRLGNPQNEVKCLHIAGTNGKGSVFSYMEDILIRAGYRVGRYISPTIFTYLERFQIDKKMMSEEDFASYIERISPVIEKMLQDGFSSPTAFETETAIAFLYFKESSVDYALIECGMGGACDATNVIDKPVASVMASISRDHMQFLGDTIEEIAENKAGIIRRNGYCISYPQDAAVQGVLTEYCRKLNAHLEMVSEKDIEVLYEGLDGTQFKYKKEQYTIAMLGEHQVLNAATAIELAKFMSKNGANRIDYDTISTAIKCTSWPGRMTKINDEPLIYVDGAHNEKAWLLLRNAVNKYFTNKNIIYIIGVLKDKEYERMLDILSDTMKEAITVTPPGERGLKKEVLFKLLKERGIACDTALGAKDALGKAIKRAKKDDVIMVCGSLSFISEYLMQRGCIARK